MKVERRKSWQQTGVNYEEKMKEKEKGDDEE